jgi:hypothetical protein
MDTDRPSGARGYAALRREVLRACGRATKFEQLGYPLRDWIRDGGEHPPHAAGVEPYLAAYLAGAEQVGRRWGTVAGLLVGVLGSGLIWLCFWMYSVVAW